jgi:hypothetical protein
MYCPAKELLAQSFQGAINAFPKQVSQLLSDTRTEFVITHSPVTVPHVISKRRCDSEQIREN